MLFAPDERPSDESSLRSAGWRVVLACFLMMTLLFGFGLYGHAVYLAELQRLNGWPAALISFASTLSFLLSNIFATFTNELMARLGPKRLVLLGIATLAGSTALLATGCGAGWHQPGTAPTGALPPRQQVQVWQAGSALRWHAVRISGDSVSGIPFMKSIACDSCRPGL